jgi:hypothetical protein
MAVGGTRVAGRIVAVGCGVGVRGDTAAGKSVAQPMIIPKTATRRMRGISVRCIR